MKINKPKEKNMDQLDYDLMQELRLEYEIDKMVEYYEEEEDTDEPHT